MVARKLRYGRWYAGWNGSVPPGVVPLAFAVQWWPKYVYRSGKAVFGAWQWTCGDLGHTLGFMRHWDIWLGALNIELAYGYCRCKWCKRANGILYGAGSFRQGN